MASFNRVILMGNLTRDIELRRLPGSSTSVAEFGLAVNDRRKTSDGQWVDDPSYFDITLFGRTAEVASEYLSKGSPVFIEGRLKQDTWENKEGQRRSKVKVIGERMQLIGGRDRSGAQHSSQVSETPAGSPYVNTQSPPQPSTSRPADAGPSGDGPGYDEPDIPF